MIDTSSSLGPPLSVSILVGLDRPDRAVVSANSLRNASSSRSNLKNYEIGLGLYMKDNVLASENFNIESPAIPDAY